LEEIRGDFILSHEDWEIGMNEFFVTFFDRRKYNRRKPTKRFSVHPSMLNKIDNFEHGFNEAEYFFDYRLINHEVVSDGNNSLDSSNIYNRDESER
jgi:hypothetical protein